MLSNSDAAEQLARRGYCLYPADPHTKRALVKEWNRAGAVSDPKKARILFSDVFRDAAIGIACGPSRLIVLDIDPKNGGDKSWRRICDELGPETFIGAPIVRTPSGGMHLYFREPEQRIHSRAHALGSGIDVIAAGNGVLAPPSRRSSGAYTWHTHGGQIDEREPPGIPDAIFERIKQGQIRAAATIVPEYILCGARNAWLTRFAGKLRRAGANESEIAAALLRANEERCKPPLKEDEVVGISRSVARYASERDGLGWLKAWRAAQPPLTLQEMRVLVFLGTLAEEIAGPLSPAGEFAAKELSVTTNHYFAARKRLEERGAIVVHNRGRNLAPIIELRFPSAA